MKLHILSDTHNEISKFDLIATDSGVAVLAGDIGKGAGGVAWAREAFPNKEIVYVPGNHEFYCLDWQETLARMRMNAAAAGVHLLDNDAVVIGGVRFLGTTLWTDFELFGKESRKAAMDDGRLYLNDFRLIHQDGTGRFTPQHSVELHEQSLAWLTAKLDEPFDGKTVVVTHHLPSMRSVADRFKDSLLSACFASNLDHLFGKMDMWIHGHTHDNMDYEVSGTRVICNPRGYVTYHGAENLDFEPGLVVEV